MDEIVRTGDKGSNSTDNGNSQGGGNPSTKSTASTERGRENNSGGSSAAGQPVEKTSQIPLVVNVEVPTETKKKRGRPKKDPNAAPAPSAPKAGRPAKGGAAGLNPLDKEQLSQIFMTFSAITASRPNMEVWALTQKEADQLAEPLANMLARSEALSKVSGTNADAVALVLAAFMIFVPKFLMWNSTRPKKPKTGDKVKYGTDKRNSRNGSTASNQTGTPNASNESPIGQPVGNDRQPNSQSNDKPAQFRGAITGLIPSLAGI